MTAGHGIAHAEDSADAAGLHGLQLWTALPQEHRQMRPAFAHHGELPRVDVDGPSVTVLVGELGGVRSPAAVYSPLVGAQVRLADRTAGLALEPHFEHAVLVVAGRARVDGVPVPVGAAGYLPPGRSRLRLTASGPVAVVLLGGVPFTEPLLMWWNFVARDHDEILAARQDWQSGRRFAPVVGHPAGPLPAPELPTTRLSPRPSGRATGGR